MRTDILKTPEWLNATAIKGPKALRNEQMQPGLHTTKTPPTKQINKIRKFYSVHQVILCVCVCVSYTLCSAKGMWKKVLFLHNWLKINSWHYLHLPKSTAQPSAPSPEVAGQAMERKIPTVKYVVDWNSQEFEQLFLGNQSIIFNNYWITTLFHISLLQLNQGLLFYCFY